MDLTDICKKLEGQTIAWSAGSLGQEQPWGEGWVDVYVEEICSLLNLNWLLTITDSAEDLAAECFQVPYDEKLLVLSQERALYKEASLEGDFSWYLQERYVDGANFLVPVWSKDAIEAAAQEWLYKESGVRLDLQWDLHLRSPIEQEIEETLQ